MGCYDTIEVKCPRCSAPYYAQSKSGDCLLRNYTLANAPADVMLDVNRHAPFECECGAVFCVEFKCLPPVVIDRKVVFVPAENKQP